MLPTPTKRVLLSLLWLPLATALGQEGPWNAPSAVGGCGKAALFAPRIAAQEQAALERELYCEGILLGMREAYEDTDVLHCDLQIAVYPGSQDNVVGTNTLTVRSEIDGLEQFTIRLRGQYAIDQALINGNTPVTVTKLTESTRVVTLDRPYAKGETFSLALSYRGRAVSEHWGSIEFGSTYAYTLSQPYYAYTWWPVKDGDLYEPGNNSDKFTLDMTIDSPAGYTAASNGVLVGTEQKNGRVLHHWKTHYPLSTYLACFSTRKYTTWSEEYTALDGSKMPVLFYLNPGNDTPGNRDAAKRVVTMLETFRKLYGEYPFVKEKYGIYQFGWGGGMEHQTFTGQGSLSEYLSAHELAHQWWGDLLTCRTWNDIWLNEGFATYSEAIWSEKMPGSQGLPRLKAHMAGIKEVASGPGTVYVSDEECRFPYEIFSYGTTYAKGAWVLHMLRHVMGDGAFFGALVDYREQFAFQGVTTRDFQSACEARYGKTLDWFFNEWIYGEYYPVYVLGWANTHVAGQDYLLLSLDQAQNRYLQRFTMPLDLRVDGRNYVLWNDEDYEHYVVPIPAPASQVELDPDGWVLCRIDPPDRYFAGPPKIVRTEPAPGALVAPHHPTSAVTIYFHDVVASLVEDYELVGKRHGKQAVALAYDPNTRAATLQLSGKLPPDQYTLTVRDSVQTLKGKALDGEITNPDDPQSLPSGDGQPGGSAVIHFAVDSGRGDLDCDGNVNFADINAFLLALQGEAAYRSRYDYCRWLNADGNQDGRVDEGDIEGFVTLLRS